jgi:hypothetical protein
MKHALLLVVPVFLHAQVTFHQHPDRLSVEIDGKPYTELFYGPDVRKPYLHPLRSALGTIVSRQFPMADVEGEKKDHPHHQGLSFTYADVNGYNFWASDKTQLNDHSGSIRLNRVVSTHDGAQDGVARIVFDWLDPKGQVLLTEDRSMKFVTANNAREIDFDITLTAVQNAVFGDTKEGMFNIRLAPGIDRMAGSNGCRNEKECWGKRGEWMRFSGKAGREDVAITIFDQPGNPSYPTYWHVREYGLFSANPFGVRDFTGDRNTDGSVTLPVGKSLHFRYRVVIEEAKPDPPARPR